MNPIGIAIKGKGARLFIRRFRDISKRYGLTARKMDQSMRRFQAILDEYGCGATFPITAVAARRCEQLVRKYHGKTIEFAVHGYQHVDHSRMDMPQQLGDFSRAQRVFINSDIPVSGFRSPYLRYNDETLPALQQAGFLYDSSQSLVWDVLPCQEVESYRRALEFYGARSVRDYPALPRIINGLVEIPYCLPDDESLHDRFQLRLPDECAQPWLTMLEESHRLGELFCLGLHPERIDVMEESLRAVLDASRCLRPAVWLARLDEIARWWTCRAGITPDVRVYGGEFHLRMRRLRGLTVLARGVDMISPARPWDGGTLRSMNEMARFRSSVRPFVGVSAGSDPSLTDFLREQGFIVETGEPARQNVYYFDRPVFRPEDARAVLQEIEQDDAPLVRLSRWPFAARSALAITGDIDAVTYWDYCLRIVGR